MAYETGATGLPVIMPGGSDMLGSGGGLGALLIGALLFGGGFGGLGRGAAGAEVAATAGLQNQINGLSGQISTLGIHDEISEVESALNAANIANLQGIAANAQTYITGNAALMAAVERGNFNTLNSVNGLGRDIIVNSNQNQLSALNSANQLNTTILQGFNELGKDTMNSTNQILAGQAAQNAFMCQCCCDIKTAIHTDGEQTRALINATNMATLQAQLSDAKSVINSQNIINALKPVVIA